MRLRPGLLRWGHRFFRGYLAVGLLLVIALYALVVANFAALNAYQVLHGQVSIARERINSNGRTIADLERQVNALQSELASLAARPAAVTCPTSQPSAGPTRPATSRPGVSARPSPTAAPQPSLPIVLPTPICVDAITCITLRPILAAC